MLGNHYIHASGGALRQLAEPSLRVPQRNDFFGHVIHRVTNFMVTL